MNSMMEEEIEMLFRLAMPEDWRNRMPSTPPPSPSINHNMEGDGNNPLGPEPLQPTNFWSEVGLRSYAQMDFDMDLSLGNKCGKRSGTKSGEACERRKKEKGFTPSLKGRRMHDSDNCGSSTANEQCSHHLDIDMEKVGGDTHGKVELTSENQNEAKPCRDVTLQESQLEFGNNVREVVPPNALCLINILRLTLDCPFSDIRKQAANVLFLLKEKGVPIPFVLVNGPCTFIHPLECPLLDVDKFASELGFADVIGGKDHEHYYEGDPEFSESVTENVRTHLDLKKARLLSEAFLSSGRVDHVIQLMAYHPDYLEIFSKTHYFLMRGDGPLPYNFRNYIAIVGAARYRCSYLMELQKREFLYQGGDPNWLRGLECVPPKLTALYTINKVMAHRPWVLKKEDLQHLTKDAGWSLSEVVQAVVILAHFHSLSSFIHGCGITPEVDFDNGHTFLLDSTLIRDDIQQYRRDNHHQGQVSFALDHLEGGAASSSSSSESDSTFLSEGTQAKQTKSILKKAESNNSFVNNHTPDEIGVPNVDPHLYRRNPVHPSSLSPPDSSFTATPSLLKSDTLHNSLCGGGVANSLQISSSSVSEVDAIMTTMKNLSEMNPIEDPEERKKRFETVARSDLDGLDQKENVQRNSYLGTCSVPGNNSNQHASMLPPDVSPFISEPEFSYEDFAKRGQISVLHTFRIQDYSWEEHGFSLVNRLYTEVGQILDDKFKVAQTMTYYTIGGRANVDTTKFRTAVWNYIQCLYGIRHDDYDYGEVNQLLERPLKAFIKTVCCYPERITKADYDNVMREFKHSEKVHVNLMIMEAKLQAELLYGLRTVMKLMF